MRSMGRQSRVHTILTVFATVCVTYLVLQTSCPDIDNKNDMSMVPREPKLSVYDNNKNNFIYDKAMPLIFIGGMPRSGTTLMRAMLDAHPDVRCGEETRVIPRLLSIRAQWMRSAKEHARLIEAGLSDAIIDDALSSFILEIIAKHGEPAPRLCNKDPFVLKSMVYMHKVFPNGQYLLMLRDGRATVHSIISRKVTISGFDITSYRDCLKKWNAAVESMYNQCTQLGQNLCLPVYYEKLVLHPEEWMRKISVFVDIPWDESVLHHEETVGKPGGISLSKREKSTDQVVKPVNLEALTKWVGHIPADVMSDIEKIAPMLAKLGYDPRANPPNYGVPDQRVIDNENKIKVNKDHYADNVRQVMQAEKQNNLGIAPVAPPDKKQDDVVDEGDTGDFVDQIKQNDVLHDRKTRRLQNPLNPKFARRPEAPYPNRR